MDATQSPRFAWWNRLLILAATTGVLVSIYQRLDPDAFLTVLRGARPGWLLAAFSLYGLLLFTAAGRWHLAMRLTDSVVHFTASIRATLIGHFFSITLFGVGIGDVAKSLLYARWYRFAFPVIFAGAKLDRLLGALGQSGVWVVTFAVCGAAGAFAEMPELTVQMPAPWKLAIAVLGLLAVAGGLCLNPGFRRGLGHFLAALCEGLKRLLHWPRVTAGGVILGSFTQGALSFVLALNLLAVTDIGIAWTHVLWLFPVIQLISALPVTVGGLGLRDAAAMTLLGLYGVPQEQAAAAALFSFVVAVAWAGIGGVALWRESNRLDAVQKRPLAESVSVIIPVLNEEVELPETLRRLQAIPQVREIIVVDGGSADATKQVARSHGCRVFDSPPGRGRQLRLGARQATGDVVMMVHADTWLPPHTGKAALNCLRDPLVVAGGFWKYFREHPSPLLYGSRWRCGLRLVFGGRVLGDQGLFVRRDVLEAIGGVPDMELMEEFRLCELLRQRGRLALAGEKVSTSARRFAKLGTLRTYWRMWIVTWKYRRGVSPGELRQRYDRRA